MFAFVAAGCTPGHKRARSAATTTTGSVPSGADSGFGSRIDVGRFDTIVASIAQTGTPRYVPEARAYISPFPATAAAAARAVYPAEARAALDAGVVVLYQRCTHLGCRVPWCASSQYFECPCHDAKFDRVGESRAGPAPRGMDLMAASIEQGRLVIDTGSILAGLPLGTDTTGQKPAGPYCV